MLRGRSRKIKIYFSFLALLLPTIGSADEIYGPEIGVLPFAMGRAYSAVADDWLALHYNPAGLALFEGVDFQITDLALGINRETVNRYSAYTDLLSAGSSLSTFEGLTGRHIHAKLGSTSQLTIPGFAMGLIYQRVIDFDNQNLVFPVTKIRDTTDFGFAAGFGFGLGRGSNRTKRLRLGMSLRYLRRTGGVKQIRIEELTSATASALLDQFSASGWGLGATLGMQFQLPFKTRSEYTMSFVWHDIGNTTFGKHTDTDRPDAIEQNMILGFSARFPIGGRANRRTARRFGHPRSSSAFILSFDYSHANIPMDELHFPRRLHFGMNLVLPVISLQAGLNQSSITLGAGVNLGAIKINASTYGEELGSFAGQRPDRRFLLSIATGLGFPKL